VAALYRRGGFQGSRFSINAARSFFDSAGGRGTLVEKNGSLTLG
jgi:hypothetical protein